MSLGVRTFNAAAELPEELTGSDRWICWQYRSKGTGKPTKVPVDPVTLKALTEWQENPARWWTYDQAVELYNANPELSGVGFVLTSDLGLIGLDLDDAINQDTGEVHEWAADHVRDFRTYTEVSPSGGGLRMFVLGALPDNVPHNVKPREIYGSGRWLTITGRTWNDGPIAANDEAVGRYVAAMRAARSDRSGLAQAPSTGARSNSDIVLAILQGAELHDSTRDYAFRLIDDGMPPAKVVGTLRGIMLNSTARSEDPARWQERYDDLPRLVGDAEAKLQRQRDQAEDDSDPFWGFKFADEMVRSLRPTSWLVQKLVPENCTGVMYGPSGSLKSFVALDMALSIANGVSWQGKPTKRRSVYYLAGEGAQGFAKRVAAWCAHNNLPPSTAFAFRQIPRIQDERDMARLVRAIDAIQAQCGQAGLIVIDTLFTALDGGDENSGKDMGQLIAAMVRLRERFGAAVFAVHHTGKQGESARGHSSLPSGMDVMLYAKPGPSPLTVEISNPKQKDGAEHPTLLLQAEVHELPLIGEDGEAESSLVLSNPSAEIIATYKGKAKKTEETVAKAQEAKQRESEARDRIKAFALEQLAQGETLELVERAVADLAQRLGFPKLARKKTALSEWRKEAGV